MSSGGNSWLGGKGGARSKAKTTREWRKKKRKREFFRTLENKEKPFFFFFFSPPRRGVIFSHSSTRFFYLVSILRESQFGRIREELRFRCVVPRHFGAFLGNENFRKVMNQLCDIDPKKTKMNCGFEFAIYELQM